MWVQIRSLPTWSCVESLRVFLSVVTIQHSLIFNLFFFLSRYLCESAGKITDI